MFLKDLHGVPGFKGHLVKILDLGCPVGTKGTAQCTTTPFDASRIRCFKKGKMVRLAGLEPALCWSSAL